MYPQYFQLSGRPFAGGPGAQFLVPNQQVAAAVEHLQDALLSRDAVALISGGPGVGKSALLEHARNGIADSAILAWADLRQSEPEQLFDSLLLSLGEDAGDGSGPDSWHRLRRAIRAHNEAGRSVTAAIDVNGITVERAKRLLRLAYLMGEPGAQLNMVLQGPHTLHKLLDVPGLINLRQRVVFRHRVRPLSQSETIEYLVKRIKAFDGDPSQLCDADVARQVYEYVAGVPRLVNTLMEAALTQAAAQRDDRLDAELIVGVANSLGWKPIARRRAVGPAPAVSAQPAAARAPAEKAPVPVERPAPSPQTPENLADSPDEAAQATHSDLTAALLAPIELSLATGAQKAPGPESFAKESESDETPPTPPPGVPEMDPMDTSATGMLRLEDLDERFAESVFAEEHSNS